MEIFKNTKLKDVMTTPVITLQEDDDFSKVEDKFEQHEIRHLPVVNKAGQFVGLMTQRDLYRIRSPRKLDDGSWYYDREMLDSFILKNVMLKEVFTLSQENTLQQAVEAMVSQKFGCVPILDSYRYLVGIVTRDDVLEFLLTQ